MAIVRRESAGDPGSPPREVREWSSPRPHGGARHGTGRSWSPPIDLVELEDGYVVSAELPGVDAEDLAIDVEERVLTLSGARPPRYADGMLLRSERTHGSFLRRLTLPAGVDPDGIVASHDRGVLEIRIPKPTQAGRRRVPVDVGGGGTTAVERGPRGDADGDPSVVVLPPTTTREDEAPAAAG